MYIEIAVGVRRRQVTVVDPLPANSSESPSELSYSVALFPAAVEAGLQT